VRLGYCRKSTCRRNDPQEFRRPKPTRRLASNKCTYKTLLISGTTFKELCIFPQTAVAFRMNLRHYIYYFLCTRQRRRGSAVGIAAGYQLDDRGVGVGVPGKSTISLPHIVPSSSVGPTQLPTQRIPDTIQEKSDRSVKLTTHLRLVPRSKRHGFLFPFLLAYSLRSA
jgi:hypothetical protein